MNRTDSVTMEREVQAFIATIIPLINPQTIIETGTYHAGTTLAILPAARNVGAVIHTYETDEGRYHTARRNARRQLGSKNDIVFHHSRLMDEAPPIPQLAILDSCLSCRREELEFLKLTAPRCVVVIHDANLRGVPQYVRSMKLPVITMLAGMGVVLTQT